MRWNLLGYIFAVIAATVLWGENGWSEESAALCAVGWLGGWYARDLWKEVSSKANLHP